MTSIEWQVWSKKHSNLTASDVIFDFMDHCFRGNISPTQDNYQIWIKDKFNKNPPPSLTIHTFYILRKSWIKKEARTETERHWYNKNIQGGEKAKEWGDFAKGYMNITAKNIVNKFMSYCFTEDLQHSYENFQAWLKRQFPKQDIPEIPKKRFTTYEDCWKRDDIRTKDEKEWYLNKKRSGQSIEWMNWTNNHDGLTVKDLVNKYLDSYFIENRTPSLEDFKKWLIIQFPDDSPPKITESMFRKNKCLWGKDECRSEGQKNFYLRTMATDWAEWSNAHEGLTAKELLFKYFHFCCCQNLSASADDFNNWSLVQFPVKPPPEIEFNTYYSYRTEWASNPQRTKNELDWYFKKILGDWADWGRKHENMSIKSVLDEFIIRCCNQNSICTWEDCNKWIRERFLDDPPPIVEKTTFGSYLTKWRGENARNNDEIKWYDEIYLRAFKERRAISIGRAFEKKIFAEVYGALKKHGLILYHETPNFGALGDHNKTTQQLKHIEGRLFTKDILNGNIGNSLRDFLIMNKRPEVVIDFTVSGRYGSKIPKYTDPATCLIVVTLKDFKGQRTLEKNVRVVNVEDFIDSHWMNLPPALQEHIKEIIKLTKSALRHGLDSPAFKTLKDWADRAWGEIQDEVNARAGRAQYEVRVGQEIAGRLRRGEMPEQLNAYVQQARDAGNTDHADRLDLMARAMAALGAHLHRSDTSKGHALEKRQYAGSDPIRADPQMTTDPRGQGHKERGNSPDVKPADQSKEGTPSDQAQSDEKDDHVRGQVRDLKRARKELAAAEKRAWRRLPRAQRDELRGDRGEYPADRKQERQKALDAVDARDAKLEGAGDPDFETLVTIERLKQERAEMKCGEKCAKAELAAERERQREQGGERLRHEAERAREREERAEARRAREKAERAERARQDANREQSPERLERGEDTWREGPGGEGFRG